MPDRTVIDELERLLGEATAGEWGTDDQIPHWITPAIGECFGLRVAANNAALIAAMKNALPALLECARALEPFAAATREIADGKSVWVERPYDGQVTADHFRQALAALEGVGR